LSIGVVGILVLAAFNQASIHQENKTLTVEDYLRAEKFMSSHTTPLVYGGNIRPTWLDDSTFWYRNTIPEGHEFILLDVKIKKRKKAFDHEKLAVALSEAVGESYEPYKLPFQDFKFSDDMNSIIFFVESTKCIYNISKNHCLAKEMDEKFEQNMMVSPDGRLGAYIRDFNLWIRDLETQKETQLTTDGVKDFGYATNNAGWTKRDRPVLLWSPDSKKIATFQHDGRGLGEIYLVTTNVGHPKLEAWKYPLPGDKEIFRIHRVVIHLDGPDSPRVVRLQMPPDQHRSTVTDHIALRTGELADAEWSPDSTQLAFVSVSRDHKHVVLRIANPETGEIRDVLEERSSLPL
jgi:hypothetical protein